MQVLGVEPNAYLLETIAFLGESPADVLPIHRPERRTARPRGARDRIARCGHAGRPSSDRDGRRGRHRCRGLPPFRRRGRARRRARPARRSGRRDRTRGRRYRCRVRRRRSARGCARRRGRRRRARRHHRSRQQRGHGTQPAAARVQRRRMGPRRSREPDRSVLLHARCDPAAARYRRWLHREQRVAERVCARYRARLRTRRRKPGSSTSP